MLPFLNNKDRTVLAYDLTYLLFKLSNLLQFFLYYKTAVVKLQSKLET